ncbi:MAG: right-handed parallel beta-helix repeat-containing protein [Thermoplasmata archaeon]|nr:MAG: right-handed parallel beta-helix repeat-containing protein [Thermoplasmata archaeon]
MGRRVITIWLSLIMMVSVIVIVDMSIDISLNVGGTTLYVNTTGSGGAYTKIQDAINDSIDGGTVFVYNGTYYERVEVDKAINLTGEDRDNTTIDGGNGGDVVNIIASWVNVSGFTVANGGFSVWVTGIRLYKVQNCSITNNIVFNNHIGIALRNNVNDCIVSDNILYNNGGNGINLDNADRNKIFNNTGYNCGGVISLVSYSDYNEISNNTLYNNWNGVSLYYYSNNNTVRDNVIHDNNEWGIGLRRYCDDNLILNNYVYSCNDGIYIHSSDSNNISDCRVYNNDHYGIYLTREDASNDWSKDNIVSYNKVSNNANYGIVIDYASDNIIYHNIVIDNMNQAWDQTNNRNKWDNGYPIGGNYWSNYGGVDYFKGPKQNIPDSDGIGDTPFVIDSNSRDNYPLMNMKRVLENCTILKQDWNLISIPFIQVEKNLTRVLGAIDSWYDAVQWYDITDTIDPWKHNRPGKPYGNDLFELDETMGFWVHITQPGVTIFLYNGTQPTSNQTITLHPGWNMVGYPSLTSYNRTEGLNNLTFGQEIDLVQWYNASTQTWHDLGEYDYFNPGRGYWIHAKAECEWEVPL